MQLEQELNALKEKAESNPIPDDALEILRRWREENARSLPKWEVTTIFTPGDENARPE